MLLPEEIRAKINELFGGLNKKMLVEKRENLTSKYKSNQAVNKSVFDSKEDSIAYAISRMPATYSVIYTLISDLVSQGKIEKVLSVFDIGSGTGAGFFACKELFENAEISLFERDLKMISVFNEFETKKDVNRFDFLYDSLDRKADLVMSSYVFSELSEEGRNIAINKMLDASNRYVLIIDTGTPRTYENFMRLKTQLQKRGYIITAPCESEKCGLKNDYCQFYARVERSSLLKMSKSGELSYEDEKYFYLLIDKNAENIENLEEARVIRRPIIKTNFVELKLCSKAGANLKNITKKDKDLYKKARKIRINEII